MTREEIIRRVSEARSYIRSFLEGYGPIHIVLNHPGMDDLESWAIYEVACEYDDWVQLRDGDKVIAEHRTELCGTPQEAP